MRSRLALAVVVLLALAWCLSRGASTAAAADAAGWNNDFGDCYDNTLNFAPPLAANTSSWECNDYSVSQVSASVTDTAGQRLCVTFVRAALLPNSLPGGIVGGPTPYLHVQFNAGSVWVVIPDGSSSPGDGAEQCYTATGSDVVKIGVIRSNFIVGFSVGSVVGTPTLGTPIPTQTFTPTYTNTNTPTNTPTNTGTPPTSTPTGTPAPGEYDCGDATFPLRNCNMIGASYADPYTYSVAGYYWTAAGGVSCYPGTLPPTNGSDAHSFGASFSYGYAYCQQRVTPGASGELYATVQNNDASSGTWSFVQNNYTTDVPVLGAGASVQLDLGPVSAGVPVSLAITNATGGIEADILSIYVGSLGGTATATATACPGPGATSLSAACQVVVATQLAATQTPCPTSTARAVLYGAVANVDVQCGTTWSSGVVSSSPWPAPWYFDYANAGSANIFSPPGFGNNAIAGYWTGQNTNWRGMQDPGNSCPGGSSASGTFQYFVAPGTYGTSYATTLTYGLQPSLPSCTTATNLVVADWTLGYSGDGNVFVKNCFSSDSSCQAPNMLTAHITLLGGHLYRFTIEQQGSYGSFHINAWTYDAGQPTPIPTNTLTPSATPTGSTPIPFHGSFTPTWTPYPSPTAVCGAGECAAATATAGPAPLGCQPMNPLCGLGGILQGLFDPGCIRCDMAPAWAAMGTAVPISDTTVIQGFALAVTSDDQTCRPLGMIPYVADLRGFDSPTPQAIVATVAFQPCSQVPVPSGWFAGVRELAIFLTFLGLLGYAWWYVHRLTGTRGVAAPEEDRGG